MEKKRKASAGLHHGHVTPSRRYLQVVFTRKTHERQVFMEDLKDHRRRKAKKILKRLKNLSGPTWYQFLSVGHRAALNSLAQCIRQDLLETSCVRTMRVMKTLGIYPELNPTELYNCMYRGKTNIQCLRLIFFEMFGHDIDAKRYAYNLNGRLILSSIFYLGLDDLKRLLKEKFKPDRNPPPPPKPKRKPKVPMHPSPYMRPMTMHEYNPEKPKKRKKPPPLPNLDFLNEPYEEPPRITKAPPPPPPPPPPKPTLPISYCDRVAGLRPIIPRDKRGMAGPSPSMLVRLARKTVTKLKTEKPKKKVYGLNLAATIKKVLRKLKPPRTGLENYQFTICGVATYNKGKRIFIIGPVSVMPVEGKIIHGGMTYLKDGSTILHHLGVKSQRIADEPIPCDCMTMYPSVLQQIQKLKCTCGHSYDYKNERSDEDVYERFFAKPSRKAPYMFKYGEIFESAESAEMQSIFNKVKEDESILHMDDDPNDPQTQERELRKKKLKEALLKQESLGCLGAKPKVVDFLRCAMRVLSGVCVVALLPDVHLTRELRVWMRRRLIGPYTHQEKMRHIDKSRQFWATLKCLEKEGLGKVHFPSSKIFDTLTTWAQAGYLSAEFHKLVSKYRVETYFKKAYTNNLLWSSMYQVDFPDKHFAETFSTYTYGCLSDVKLFYPYNSIDVEDRATAMRKGRYVCLAKGAADAMKE